MSPAPAGPADAAAIALAAQRRLTESIGGTYHQLADLDIPDALLTLARTENATQLVLGTAQPHPAGSTAAQDPDQIPGHPRLQRNRRAYHHPPGKALPRWPSGKYHVRSVPRSLFPNGPGICRSPGSCAYNAGAPSDSGFVKSTQKTTVPIQQT